MERRSFIGSVIGTIMGLSFKAQLPAKPPELPIITEHDSKFRVLMRDSHRGVILHSPGIFSIKRIIERTTSGFNNHFELKCQPLVATQSLLINKALLCDSQGKLLRVTSTPYLSIEPRDTLYLTLDMIFHSTKEEESLESGFAKWQERCKRYGIDPAYTTACSGRPIEKGNTLLESDE